MSWPSSTPSSSPISGLVSLRPRAPLSKLSPACGFTSIKGPLRTRPSPAPPPIHLTRDVSGGTYFASYRGMHHENKARRPRADVRGARRRDRRIRIDHRRAGRRHVEPDANGYGRRYDRPTRLRKSWGDCRTRPEQRVSGVSEGTRLREENRERAGIPEEISEKPPRGAGRRRPDGYLSHASRLEGRIRLRRSGAGLESEGRRRPRDGRLDHPACHEPERPRRARRTRQSGKVREAGARDFGRDAEAKRYERSAVCRGKIEKSLPGAQRAGAGVFSAEQLRRFRERATGIAQGKSSSGPDRFLRARRRFHETESLRRGGRRVHGMQPARRTVAGSVQATSGRGERREGGHPKDAIV